MPLSKIQLMSFVNIDLSFSGFPVYLEILIASCSSKIDLGRPGMTFSHYSAYSLHNQTLENVQSAKYLGITISDKMDWGQHISEISSKATKTLGFLRRNLAFAPRSTKEVAYKTLVRPKLEYAAPIWSPYSKLQINQVEKVQRTAAVGPAGDGVTQVVSARCLMSLSGHLLRPVGIGPPCFSFIRYILVLCL